MTLAAWVGLLPSTQQWQLPYSRQKLLLKPDIMARSLKSFAYFWQIHTPCPVAHQVWAFSISYCINYQAKASAWSKLVYSTLATGQKSESHKYVPRSIHICIAQHPTVIPVLEGTYWCTLWSRKTNVHVPTKRSPKTFQANSATWIVELNTESLDNLSGIVRKGLQRVHLIPSAAAARLWDPSGLQMYLSIALQTYRRMSIA